MPESLYHLILERYDLDGLDSTSSRRPPHAELPPPGSGGPGRDRGADPAGDLRFRGDLALPGGRGAESSREISPRDATGRFGAPGRGGKLTVRPAGPPAASDLEKEAWRSGAGWQRVRPGATVDADEPRGAALPRYRSRRRSREEWNERGF